MREYKVIPLKYPIIIAGAILLLAFSPIIYHKIIRPNKHLLPKFIASKIEERENRKKPSPIVYKEEVDVKVLEGWTIDVIAKHLEDISGLDISFKKLAGEPMVDYREKKEEDFPADYSEKFDFLETKPKHYSLEGFLFPDTYRVFKQATSSEALILKMLSNFDKKLNDELRAEIKRQGKTIYDVIIMASLIEKEAPIDYKDTDNRSARIVSDIFWSRLKIGMALQSDATLSYYFSDNNPAHSSTELQVDTPYNSYMYKGLPPTPICNPSLKAIEAAVYPIPTDYTYFLTTRDGSEIFFSKTYAEHLAYKNKYLK